MLLVSCLSAQFVLQNVVTFVFRHLSTVFLQVLIDWINDELADFRIIVKDLEEDLFDGQILQKLIGMRLV